MPCIKNVFNRKDMISFGKYCKALITDVKLSNWCVMGEGEKEAHIDNLLDDWIVINEITPKKEKKGDQKHEFDYE